VDPRWRGEERRGGSYYLLFAKDLCNNVSEISNTPEAHAKKFGHKTVGEEKLTDDLTVW
jgi:hypothetical protein